LRDVQRLLRHARPETTLGSYDITGEALERHASHQIAGFLAGWAG
jgi:integrase/recombinase XerD